MRLTQYLFLLFLLTGCSGEEIEIHTPNWKSVDFEYDHYEKPYEFSAIIDLDSDPQEAGVDNSFIGNYAEALRWFDQREEQPAYDKNLVAEILAKHEFVSAIPLILDSAKNHQVVIVNEAHHVSTHRVFTRRLLQGLYDRGYRHFGLETLSTKFGRVDSLNANGVVKLNTGYYTREAEFAKLLREAYRIGFRFFAYESSGNSGDDRETDQAHNIAEYIRTHPKEKVLIHCGYGHSAEALPDGTKIPMMAGHLSDTLGIDLLTINQTRYTEAGSPAYDQPILRQSDLTEPATLIDADGRQYLPTSGLNAQDIFVFHPNVKLIHGRPDYVFSGKSRPHGIQLGDLNLTLPALLHVYRSSEDMKTAVPVDILEARSETAVTSLMTGSYQLLVIDSGGKKLTASLDIQ